METKKKAGVGIGATVIALLGVVGGIEVLNIDFSQDNDITNIDDHSNTQTNIFGEIQKDIIEAGVLAGACLQEPIPKEYTEACKNR